MVNQFYDTLDKLFSTIVKPLNIFNKSEIIQEYFFRVFKSIFYASLLNNFFLYLNSDNMKACGLSSDYVEKIKRKYKKMQEDIKIALSEPYNEQLIDETYYENFKAQIKRDFPNVLKLISEIERKLDTDKAKKYLENKEEEIKKIGMSKEDFNSRYMTKVFEVSVNQKHPLNPDNFESFFTAMYDEAVPRIPEIIEKSLKLNLEEIINEHRKVQIGFEEGLYELWKEPLDLLESLIQISIESGRIHKKKLDKVVDETNKFKFSALIQIHARACQISNEILVLLKAGYVDGVLARWRALYELAVVSLFLSNSDNETSERYLEHEIWIRNKDAKEYQKYCKKLDYRPLEEEIMQKIENGKENLPKKYGDEFKYDWDWIPRTVLSNPYFKALAERVGLGHLLPFYSRSTAATHGLSRGFYRSGLMAQKQHDILLCGGSNYGLADPLQLTCISLRQITENLLSLQFDSDSLSLPFVMKYFCESISNKAVNTQKAIEKEESSKLK